MTGYKATCPVNHLDFIMDSMYVVSQRRVKIGWTPYYSISRGCLMTDYQASELFRLDKMDSTYVARLSLLVKHCLLEMNTC